MRSWSSRTGPTSSGSSGWCSSSACAWRASRVDSRRRRSIARLRAVVTIHAPGLGGRRRRHFSDGHRERVLDGLLGESDVTEEARQRGHAPAVLRPVDAVQIHQRRRDPSSNGRTSIGCPQASAHFSAQASAWSRSSHLDHPEPAELFLRLGERAVGHRGRAARGADDRAGVRVLQAADEHPHTGGLHLGGDLARPGHLRLHVLFRLRRRAFVELDGEQVLLHGELLRRIRRRGGGRRRG